MKEVWKDIEGYEGLYQVSNFGNVKSLDRYVGGEKCGRRFIKGKKMKKAFFSNGYVRVPLCKNGEVHNGLVHRLVANAFIDNPNNLPQVNHKDENITNNRADNLEWCTPKYNANYGTRNKKCGDCNKIPIDQYDLDGNFIRRWDSAKDASDAEGHDRKSILWVCKGRWKHHHNYIWKYA